MSGKGKQKGGQSKWKVKGEDDDKEEEQEVVPRTRIGEGRCTGLVLEWRGHMGWIQPLTKIKHENAAKHHGRIYLTKDDVQDVANAGAIKEGKMVDFFVYADHDGLGAEECRPLSVLRCTLPHSEANNKIKYSSEWSEYLGESEYYPAFEREHGCILRKYNWQNAFAVYELWGPAEVLPAATVFLGTTTKTAEGEAEERQVRLLLEEADVGKVDAMEMKLKVTTHNVLNKPVPCRSVTIQGSTEACIQAVKDFMAVMSKPAPATAAAPAAEVTAA